MATLKKNRDNVPLDVLKTKYKKGYTALCEDLRLLTSDFIRSIVLKDIAVMPKYMPDVVQIIETTVKDSGLLKECSKAVYRQQDFEELKSTPSTTQQPTNPAALPIQLKMTSDSQRRSKLYTGYYRPGNL